MTRRLLTGTLFAVGLAVALLASPAAAQYQPTQSQTVSDTTPTPGQEVVVNGTGCMAGSSVTTTLDGTTVATSTADAGESFFAAVTIPVGTASGSHDLTSTCGTVVLTSTISVLGARVDHAVGNQASTNQASTNQASTNQASTNQALAHAAAAGAGPVSTSLARTGSDTARLAQIGVVIAALGGGALALSRSRRLRAS